jgi:hypothetical protein
MTQKIKISDDIVMNKIYYIRDQKVMLDFDLAELYAVENRALKQAIKRNYRRFPEDFMFQLTKDEWQELITICDKFPQNLKHSPVTPLAFTEQGVTMLSCILNSEHAIHINIQIIRVFTRIRQIILDNSALRLEIEKIKSKLDKHDKNMQVVFHYLDELMSQKAAPAPRKRIGYKSDDL